jgi:hypothetical protein
MELRETSTGPPSSNWSAERHSKPLSQLPNSGDPDHGSSVRSVVIYEGCKKLAWIIKISTDVWGFMFPRVDQVNSQIYLLG